MSSLDWKPAASKKSYASKDHFVGLMEKEEKKTGGRTSGYKHTVLIQFGTLVDDTFHNVWNG